MDFGPALAKIVDRARDLGYERRRRVEADRQLAQLAACRAARHGDRPFGLRQGGARLGQEEGADIGQLDIAAAAIEQADAEFLLQHLDLVAERRLRDAEPLGGLAEMEFLGDADEVTKVAQFHGSISNRYRSCRK